jgi:hypothetical protein
MVREIYLQKFEIFSIICKINLMRGVIVIKQVLGGVYG